MVTLYKFQVPKGMLQTMRPSTYIDNQGRFQVPKGMLQTCASIFCREDHVGGFKSPRECYKHWNSNSTASRVTTFQVPKGMLQTLDREYRTRLHIWFQVPKGMLQTRSTWSRLYKTLGFKSPRECYKLKVRESKLKVWKVSSPQGNATNGKRKAKEASQHVFQVPKGMLQTKVK